MQFRTKARAVDLLGKGQIADLPTAITELWKNGYDAYADNLTAEIFQKQYSGLENDVFLLTDDGKGMSQKDIFEKWLVLGTDSKSRAELELEPDIDTLWKKPRIKAGEKGIGRLSVAFLGQPMLMLTKKIGSPVQMLFFDWRLLENFNLYLDDINLPVASLENTEDLAKTFRTLKVEFLQNFKKKIDLEGNLIWENKQCQLKRDILHSLVNAKLSDKLIEDILNDFTDLKEDHGTRFLIFEPIDQILELAEENKDESRENRDFIISSLSGFFNPFIGEKNKVNTYFYIHQLIGNDKELFNLEANFFSPSDYDLADILIEGDFDGNGSFSGDLKIYDQKIKYDFTTSRRKFQKKYYGKIKIKLGYSVGEQKDSKLSDTAFKKINDKVTRNGGLYLYRDNFRILPYGRPNSDFLKFEERRNKRFSTYFFSYRRMFGYLGLTREGNAQLRDKSSREGLINNDQYRAFEDDLISFFIQIAKDYFSDKSENSIFLDERKKLNKQNEAISEDKKRETEEKKAFSRSLSNYPSKFKEFEKDYESVLKKLEEKVGLAETTYNDIELILEELQLLDLQFENLLPEIPKRYSPTDLQLDRLNKYEDQIMAFNKNVKVNSATIMQKVHDKLELHELKKNFEKNAEVYQGELENIVANHYEILNSKFNGLINEYNSRGTAIIQEFNKVKLNGFDNILTKNDIGIQADLIKNEYERQKELTNKTLIPLTEHINRMTFDIDEELLQGAYKSQFEQMKQQWSMVQDTAQLGIAVEIIDHEFNVLYSRINRLLEGLDKNIVFNNSNDFKLLEKTFRSLEDKYDLLSPLYRIQGGITKDIQCSQIHNYIEKFFSKQLDEENIDLSATPAFLKKIINIKEPIIYTVFINIVNNAIFWVRNSDEKKVVFDYLPKTDEILILNSGRKIEEHRLNKIFDLFYSNRPSGRGIGLYLAKQSLNENYFDIEATNNDTYNYLGGACFVIKPIVE